jgi:Domain of unknown function (DU1801)
MAYEAKTKPGPQSAEAFIKSIVPEKRGVEAARLLSMLKRLTGEEPVLWGSSIIGFGSYDYTYDSGHSGSSMRIGFSPRKAAMTVYLVPGFDNRSDLLQKLGPHSIGKSCLYIKDLAKVDAQVLEELISASINEMNERYPPKT